MRTFALCSLRLNEHTCTTSFIRRRYLVAVGVEVAGAFPARAIHVAVVVASAGAVVRSLHSFVISVGLFQVRLVEAGVVEEFLAVQRKKKEKRTQRNIKENEKM